MVATHPKMTQLRPYWALIVFAGIAGCASAPSMNYYTLDMRASGGATLAGRIEIARLRVAEPLEGRNILVQTSPTKIEYYAVDQWVAGLDDLVQEKLEAEWGDAEKESPAQVVLEGIIQGFGQEDLPERTLAYLKLTAEFRSPNASRYDAPLLRKTYEFREPLAEDSAAGVVTTLSVCVEQLAAAMAADVKALGTNR